MDMQQFTKFERWALLASVAELVNGKVTAAKGYSDAGTFAKTDVAVEGVYGQQPVRWQIDFIAPNLIPAYYSHAVRFDLPRQGQDWRLTHSPSLPGFWGIVHTDDALHERLVQAKAVDLIRTTMKDKFPFPETTEELQAATKRTTCAFFFSARTGALNCGMDNLARGYTGPTSDQGRAVLDSLVTLARINAEINTDAPTKRRFWPWAR